MSESFVIVTIIDLIIIITIILSVLNRRKAVKRGVWNVVFIISLFLFIISIAFFINELYKLKCKYVIIWSVSDTLQLYGSILTFVGTMFLGFVTLVQNHRAIETEKLSLELVMNQYIPSFDINHIKIVKDAESDIKCPDNGRTVYEVLSQDSPSCTYLCFDLEIVNINKQTITEFSLKKIVVRNNHYSWKKKIAFDFPRIGEKVSFNEINYSNKMRFYLKSSNEECFKEIFSPGYRIDMWFDLKNALNKDMLLNISLINMDNRKILKNISTGKAIYVKGN